MAKHGKAGTSAATTEQALLWETPEVEASGFRLCCAVLTDGAISLWLLRRTVVFIESEPAPHQQKWWVASEIIIYPPVAMDELLRLSAHWCDFYDPRLKATLPGLAAALSARLALPAALVGPREGTQSN